MNDEELITEIIEEAGSHSMFDVHTSYAKNWGRRIAHIAIKKARAQGVESARSNFVCKRCVGITSLKCINCNRDLKKEAEINLMQCATCKKIGRPDLIAAGECCRLREAEKSLKKAVEERSELGVPMDKETAANILELKAECELGRIPKSILGVPVMEAETEVEKE